MSWEKMFSKSIVCPCGNGKIEIGTYGDDWNRYEDRVSIVCSFCSEKYRIEKVSQPSHKPHRGDFVEYFLVSKEENNEKIKLEWK